MLFTTATCPNCKIAKGFLEKAGVDYQIIDANENAALAEQFDIRQAPTLVIANGEDFTAYAGASNIKKFTESAVVS